MHRDNPDVPVGEFVDAMDAGGQGWAASADRSAARTGRRERMDEAIAYAERNGKQAPGALSNNFSLAEMLGADLGRLRRLLRRRMEGLADAHGRCRISPGRARAAASSPIAPGATSATMRNWCGSGIRRRISAAATARSSSPSRLGKSPIHVALAYVLAQPFPSVPLIGPRTLGELDDSLQALDIALSKDDLAWLDGAAR